MLVIPRPLRRSETGALPSGEGSSQIAGLLAMGWGRNGPGKTLHGYPRVGYHRKSKALGPKRVGLHVPHPDTAPANSLYKLRRQTSSSSLQEHCLSSKSEEHISVPRNPSSPSQHLPGIFLTQPHPFPGEQHYTWGFYPPDSAHIQSGKAL